MDRGVTCLHSQSGFRENETEMVVSAISAKELPKMESLIKNIDSSAFVIVNKTTEVFGRGFTERNNTKVNTRVECNFYPAMFTFYFI